MMKKVVFLFIISVFFFTRSATAFNLPELNELYEEYKQCKIDDAMVEKEINELLDTIVGYESTIEDWKSVLAGYPDSDLAKDAPGEIDKHMGFINKAKGLIDDELVPFRTSADDWMKKVVTKEPVILNENDKEFPDDPPIKEIVKTKQKDTPEQPPGDDKPDIEKPKIVKPKIEKPKIVEPKITKHKIDKKETDYSGDFFATPKDDVKSPYQVEEDTKKHFYDKKPKSPRTPSGDADNYKGVDDALGDL